MGTPAQAARFHALDAFRAAMMLAVVVLHAAILYSDRPAGRMVFRFSDPDGGPEFFWLALLLQSVSMPGFFLAAGFFAAMLAARCGPRGMLAHRLRRLTLPFLVFWPGLYALTMAGMLFGTSVAAEIVVPQVDDPGAVLRHVGTAAAAGTPFSAALDLRWPRPADELVRFGTLDGSEGAPPVWAFRGPGAEVGPAAWAAVRFVPVGLGLFARPSTNHIIHLWFLWVLTLLVAAAALVAPLAARLPTRWLGRRLDSAAFPWLGVVPFAAVFYWHQLPVVPPPPHLGVPLPTVLGYALFFATGALLWRHRDRITGVGRHWPAHLILGVAAWSAGWALTPGASWWTPDPDAGEFATRLAASLAAAVGHWQLVWGCLGFALRHAAAARPWVRYLSDASYWVYLVHLPVVLWVAAALLPWDTSRFVKFLLVLAAGFGLPLITYHLAVRRTFIGVFLNGRRAGPDGAASDPTGRTTYASGGKMPIFPGLPRRIH
jgi:peptidoglycan/LPS O-acetylase OafA/YrhL